MQNAPRPEPDPKDLRGASKLRHTVLGRSGGRVFTFPSWEALDPVSEYYEEFGGVFASYVYVEGNVLAQIDGEVPEE